MYQNSYAYSSMQVLWSINVQELYKLLSKIVEE
jgi:hypothetical protein